jgi:hypothetical protein
MLAQNQVRRSGIRELGRILKPRLIVAMSVSAMEKAGAHHSFAVFFDAENKVVKVAGIVKDFQFRNPHGAITLSVREGSDTVIWRAERQTDHLEAATITNNGLDHTEHVHVLERFRLSPDGRSLLATQEFADSEVIENRGVRFAWTRERGQHVFPYECDPNFAGSYSQGSVK